MSGLAPSTPILTPRQQRRRLLAARVDGGVEAAPAGPAIPPLVVRNSSFAGFPAGHLAISSETPAATLARYSAG